MLYVTLAWLDGAPAVVACELVMEGWVFVVGTAAVGDELELKGLTMEKIGWTMTWGLGCATTEPAVKARMM